MGLWEVERRGEEAERVGGDGWGLPEVVEEVALGE